MKPPSRLPPETGRWLRAHLATLWAVAGVGALFAVAVIRLGWRGVRTISGGLGPLEWSALTVLTLLFVYGEGHLALDRRWVPGLIRRARALRAERSHVIRLLAPLHGLSLISGPRAQVVRAWLGTGAIVGAVLVVRVLPEPWRGIVDFAVAAALAWGLVAIVRRLPDLLGAGPEARDGSRSPARESGTDPVRLAHRDPPWHI